MTFGWINWCVVAVVVLGTTLLGHLLKGKSTGVEGFFLGGRNLPWWAVSASIMASQISAVTVIAVRGHADPTKTLMEFVQAGMKKGILKRSGSSGDYNYSLKGKPLSLESTELLAKLIDTGEFDGVAEHNPRETMQAALNLSRKRAEEVRESVVKYATSKGLGLDPSQIQPVGVGVREPFIAKPANMAEAVIIATVLEPCAIFSSEAMKKPSTRSMIPVTVLPPSPANIAWIAGPICAACSMPSKAPPAEVMRMINPPLISAFSTASPNSLRLGLRCFT